MSEPETPQTPRLPFDGSTFWTPPERFLIIGALQGMSAGLNGMAAEMKRLADCKCSVATAEIASLQLQTELARKSLELLNNQPTVRGPAISEAETTAGGMVPGLVPLPTKRPTG